MEFKRTGPESVEIKTHDGTVILFSYGEPVAAYCRRGIGRGVSPDWGVVKTEKFISRSTTAHVAAFVAGRGVYTVPHSFILEITKGAR